MKREGLRLVIAGGGTGGHLFPGLAVAEEVVAQGGQVLFVGCGRKVEELALAKTPFAVETLNAEGLLGRPLFAKVRALGKMTMAVIKALKIVQGFNPQVVLGVGGYASVPVLMAAKMLRLPCAIHEQNSIPGVANRVLARLANRVFVSFKEAEAFFPASKVRHTGNPVRKTLKGPYPREHKGLGLLITGGSQGARALNELALQVVPGLIRRFPGLYVIHQTGFKDYDRVSSIYQVQGLKVKVFPFIEDMAWAYAQVDLVICRAGATTIAELCSLGKPAIYIPFPYATHSHQERNAEVVVANGAGVMFRERDLTAEVLLETVIALLEDDQRRERMAQAAREVFPARPVERILKEMEALVGHVGA